MNTDPDGITAGVEGTFEGGYRAVFWGLLKESPPRRTRGKIGAFDYGWNGNDTTDPSTPFSSLSTYFDSVVSYYFTYEWWGWIYKAGGNVKWVNSSDGNFGDITDGP